MRRARESIREKDIWCDHVDAMWKGEGSGRWRTCTVRESMDEPKSL